MFRNTVFQGAYPDGTEEAGGGACTHERRSQERPQEFQELHRVARQGPCTQTGEVSAMKNIKWSKLVLVHDNFYSQFNQSFFRL